MQLPQRALVTGATGCLGRHLAIRLADAGWDVRASGRNRAIGRTLPSERITFVEGDLLDDGLPQRLTENVDVVFHCAALSSAWGPTAAFERANVEVTRRLCEAARASGCRRLVHVSSTSIYFAYRDALNIRETMPLPKKFVNAYAASKAKAENVVKAAGDRGLPIVILRPRGIFGEHDTALAPRLLRFSQRGAVPLLRGGDALVDVTYAGNVADAMILAAAPGAPQGIFNISNGHPLTVRDLLARTFAALGEEVTFRRLPYRLLDAAAAASEATARLLRASEPALLRYTLGVMAFSQTLDISAARHQLGYQPAISIDEGLARFAAWHRHQQSHSPAHDADLTPAGAA